jgi:hypothetical protein
MTELSTKFSGSARAIEIAFEQDDVREVISTLQAHSPRERSRPWS